MYDSKSIGTISISESYGEAIWNVANAFSEAYKKQKTDTNTFIIFLEMNKLRDIIFTHKCIGHKIILTYNEVQYLLHAIAAITDIEEQKPDNILSLQTELEANLLKQGYC